MNELMKKVPFVDQILKGVGQIMLQENSWTGIMFLLGIFIASWTEGFAAVLATASGTLMARILKYNQKEIDAGLYGFSAALVGVALSFLYEPTPTIWILIVIGGALASILQHFFIQKKVPAFTFPFIVITWVCIYMINHFAKIPHSEMFKSGLVTPVSDNFLTATNGFGEVIFQGGAVSGLIFFVAVFINSPIAALYGFTSSSLGALISHLIGEPIDQINIGLFGFNAVLSAIVFAGPKKSDGVWVLIATLITVFIDITLIETGILNEVGGVLTFPFVAGTGLTLLLQKLVKKT